MKLVALGMDKDDEIIFVKKDNKKRYKNFLSINPSVSPRKSVEIKDTQSLDNLIKTKSGCNERPSFKYYPTEEALTKMIHKAANS